MTTITSAKTEILSDHFQATRARLVAHEGPALVLQDTTVKKLSPEQRFCGQWV